MARTKGRVKYAAQESFKIMDKIATTLRTDQDLVNLIKNSDQLLNDDANREKKLQHIETVTMANYIRENEELTEKIQLIFLEHGIEIEPSQAVTKNEAIGARKQVIKALLS